MGGIGPISETPRQPVLFVGPDPATWLADVATAAANYTVGSAFTVPSPITVSTAYFKVAVQSGYISFSILDANTMSVLAWTESFACPAAGQRSRALLAPVTLLPGVVYYRCYSMDNATVSVQMTSAAPSLDILVNGAVRHLNFQANQANPAAPAISPPSTTSAFVPGVIFA